MEWVQVDEPILVLDHEDDKIQELSSAFQRAYSGTRSILLGRTCLISISPTTHGQLVFRWSVCLGCQRCLTLFTHPACAHTHTHTRNPISPVKRSVSPNFQIRPTLFPLFTAHTNTHTKHTYKHTLNTDAAFSLAPAAPFLLRTSPSLRRVTRGYSPATFSHSTQLTVCVLAFLIFSPSNSHFRPGFSSHPCVSVILTVSVSVSCLSLCVLVWPRAREVGVFGSGRCSVPEYNEHDERERERDRRERAREKRQTKRERRERE